MEQTVKTTRIIVRMTQDSSEVNSCERTASLVKAS